MRERSLNLTSLYNLFHDPNPPDAELDTLRTLHCALDHAVATAYGWTGLDLGHGFHETKQGIRYTISESARRTVLDRLLALNHERYAEEVKQGLHDKDKKAKTPRKPKSAASEVTPASTPQLGLFAPPATPVEKPTPAQQALALGGPDPAETILDLLRIAYAPLGKAHILAQANLPEPAWAPAIASLKARGLIEQVGEKRGTAYRIKR